MPEGSVTSRLIAYHIERLKNKNPETRRDAINELRLIGDPTVLDALEQIFKTDPEPEVRKAAQQAGLEIFLKNRKTP
jgi:HEAT repeat protein